MSTKVAKKKFSQAERDRLEMRKAQAVLAYRKAKEQLEKARDELRNYDKTH
jgi:hypothetical protein